MNRDKFCSWILFCVLILLLYVLGVMPTKTMIFQCITIWKCILQFWDLYNVSRRYKLSYPVPELPPLLLTDYNGLALSDSTVRFSDTRRGLPGELIVALSMARSSLWRQHYTPASFINCPAPLVVFIHRLCYVTSSCIRRLS